MSNSMSNAITALASKRVLIVGLGKTGLSCARFLNKRGIEVAVTDSRDNPPGLEKLKQELPDIAVFVGAFSQEVFERADVLIVSPGVSVNELHIQAAEARGAEVIGDVELFARIAEAPVLAITGSNGKSTVTTLLGEMVRVSGLNVAVGGNLGTPVLDLLEQPVPDFYVLELSSFQLETTSSLNAMVSTLLNISEDHMDRYNSLEEYIRAKTRIFSGNGTVVLNKDDVQVIKLKESLTKSHKIIEFTLEEPVVNEFGICNKDNQRWLCIANKNLLPVNKLKIKGMHNLANALAALALGQAAGLPMDTMLQALQAFPGLPHRTQWVANIEGVDWFNDSKATNVGAAQAAINGVEARQLILIAGGQGKGQDFSPLKETVQEKVSTVILLGEDSRLLKDMLDGSAEIFIVNTMNEAVNKAASIAQQGDAVLLSPACASFDMFSGYEERGNVFIKAVKEVQS
ncbi:MAG: UDP-N-acetylmuramoyl-L-alanine--D-glutamate ligase [Gammaproteobacteria bacterium]